ncbi:MAG: hypothetical protein ABJE63_02005 [Lentilitoribacter sp.]
MEHINLFPLPSDTRLDQFMFGAGDQLCQMRWKIWRSRQADSARQTTMYDINAANLESEQHRFTEWHEDQVYAMIQKRPLSKDVFWIYSLRVVKVFDEKNVDIEIHQVLEVEDTGDGLVHRADIVPAKCSEIIALGGDTPHTMKDKEMIEHCCDDLPKQYAADVFLAAQNWAYRKSPH